MKPEQQEIAPLKREVATLKAERDMCQYGRKSVLNFQNSLRSGTEDESTKLTSFPEVFRMKAFLIGAGIIVALYVADHQYANGKYTSAGDSDPPFVQS